MRIALYRRFLREKPGQLPTGERERRALSMLLCTLFGADVPGDLLGALHRLYAHPAICAELEEMLDVLADAVRHAPHEAGLAERIPLRVHCRYSLAEVMAAFGQVRDGVLVQPREGVAWVESESCDLLFVTLRKSEKEYSPSTMYEDYALSREEFHWQSQSTTRPETEKGRRHWQHRELNVTPLLFVRDTKKDNRDETMPYLFLGPVDYVSHEGERPMSIVWRLRTPMPADVVRLAGVA